VVRAQVGVQNLGDDVLSELAFGALHRETRIQHPQDPQHLRGLVLIERRDRGRDHVVRRHDGFLRILICLGQLGDLGLLLSY